MNELFRKILFLPPQSSTIAPQIDHLHYFVISMTIAGAWAVTLIGGYFVIRYRRSMRRPVTRDRAAPNAPLWLELTIVVSLFSLFVAWWWMGFRQFVRMRVAPENAMNVYVTAKQWMWKFAYPDGQRSIAALFVPARHPVKLLMTSRDVIHSFYVPDFRIKQDVIPGRYTTVWFEANAPGTYQILCAEFCGTSHSTMRGEVVALEPDDFARWKTGDLRTPIAEAPYVEPATVEDFTPRQPLDMARLGERAAAEHGCLRCHTLDGTPHIGPTWAGMYGATVELADGTTANVDEAYITESMMDPAAKHHRGFQLVMPSYAGQIRPFETAAIIELIRSIRDRPAEAPGSQP